MPCDDVLESDVDGDHSVSWLRSVARMTSGVKKNVKLWVTMAATWCSSSVRPQVFDLFQAAFSKSADDEVTVFSGKRRLSGDASLLSVWKMSPVIAA